MDPDAHSIINEMAQIQHHSWDEGENMFLFVYGNKKVGKGGSWRHPHCYATNLLDNHIAKAHAIVVHN